MDSRSVNVSPYLVASRIFVFLGATSAALLGALLGYITSGREYQFESHKIYFYGLFFIVTLSVVVVAFCNGVMDAERQIEANSRIVSIEKEARDHPDKPQLAWDAARAKLESYLDRNLGQLKWIFWLTLTVMCAGFGLIIFGITNAYNSDNKLPVSVIAASSGVIISFIGGSFLIVYKYILEQSRSYVTVLERINAVGMAVQVLGSISDEDMPLRNRATADLAKQLIQLYATDNAPKGGRVARKAS